MMSLVETRKRDILEFVQNRKTVSMYDLIEKYLETVDSDTLVSIVYYLAGSHLLVVTPEEGEDGIEIVLSPSLMTTSYLRGTKG